MITLDQAKEVINGVLDPVIGRPLSDLKAVKNVSVEDGAVSVTINPGYPIKSTAPKIEAAVKDALLAQGSTSVTVNVMGNIVAHRVQRTLKTLANVKNIIAISSGKGGVGKSTVTANFALALAAEGARVGVLDADIYGPSQPTMLGASGQPESFDGVNMEPIESLGLEINSIGFMIDPNEPMIWRGPLVAQALTQLLNQTNWHDLDYLVIDMPPGTGDVQLTLSQSVPVTGAVVVTTPQDIALLDAKKGLRMFEKVNVPVLGIVENMAMYRCPECGHMEHIFGQGGAERMSKQYNVPVLGQLPLDSKIREQADTGLPTVVAEPESDVAAIYREIALKAAATVAMTSKDMSRVLPTVKVVND
jgi:ATP-binding protein involved in chromosome partitioning